MTVAGFVLLLSRLVVGAVATFLAILVWSRTREAAWILVVTGVIASYAAIVYGALELFGIVSADALVLWGIPVPSLLTQNVPMLLFVAALAVVLSRRPLG